MSGFSIFKRMSGMLSGWATACETGQLDRVDQFLSSTSNVPTPAEVSRGLVSACRWGHVSLVLRLLQLPVEPPAPSYKGPLRPSVVDPIPCEGGSAAASGAGGGGPQPPGVVTETAVGVACQGGHTDVVRLLMREPGADSAAGTLLMFACQGGHSDIVDMLLEKPLSSVTPEEIGRSFVAACKAGFYGIAAALIALNPPHMRPNLAFAAGTGETPLCAACGAGVLEVVNLLLETMGSSTVYAKEIFLEPATANETFAEPHFEAGTDRSECCL
ncbi:hypothetical protein Pelo_16646 [Pelomyxa schiedti]|nr:hypothetical protein Pelo_16646 [Pelomyxa schiedti]